MIKAGLYVRISKNDPLNESIENQKEILRNYCITKNIFDYEIFCDNGYSGTNFERPEFKKMFEKIKSGVINTVIVKDFSRLGRDYIETGNFIEKVFPRYNVRCISILDGYDSYDELNDYMPFKFILNDMYSKDISKKIRSSLENKKKQGLYLGSKAPYGYDKFNKYYLVLNNECHIVKFIFNLFIDNINANKIAKILTNLNILSPNGNKRWSCKTIKDILANPVYTGDLVQGKRKRISYKCRKIVNVCKENFIVCKCNHPMIIDYNTWDTAQKKLIINKKEKLYFKYKDMLWCKECNKKINILYNYKRGHAFTSCSSYRNKRICTPHYFNYNEIEKRISDEKNIQKIYIDKDKNIQIKRSN